MKIKDMKSILDYLWALFELTGIPEVWQAYNEMSNLKKRAKR